MVHNYPYYKKLLPSIEKEYNMIPELGIKLLWMKVNGNNGVMIKKVGKNVCY